MQQIRREIGQLEGNLDRTFTAVNRWMGGTLAERDAKMQRAHKVLGIQLIQPKSLLFQ